MNHKKSPLLGAHMSIAGGLEKAIERGESIGCTAIQIFTKSNRQIYAKPITPKEADLFKKTAAASSIQSIVAHASYLINLGSPNESTATQSIKSLITELHRCDQLDIPYLVVHPGSHVGTDEQECLERITANIDSILKQAKTNTMLLLETMAGQGSSVCYRFEDIATIINNSSHGKSLGVCFDTCHTFVAGYDFRTEKAYTDMWHSFDTIIGLEKLKAIHLNDSKKDVGSFVDRHEDIGKGKLGIDTFRFIMNDKRFTDIPKILETPKDNLEDDRRNLEILRSLICS